MQDEALEALGKGVDRLNDLGSAINVELKDQEKMLGGLSGDMDEAEGKMNMVNHYLKKLLNTKDSCQYGTIVVLGKCMKQFFPSLFAQNFSYSPSYHLPHFHSSRPYCPRCVHHLATRKQHIQVGPLHQAPWTACSALLKGL